MDADDRELAELQGNTAPAADLQSTILDLRRIVYRCELLQQGEFTDGANQSLWESVVVTYCACFTQGALAPDQIHRLAPAHRETHELLERERSRHVVGESTVIPDAICDLDLEIGALAPPYVDPAAARSLAEALIAQLLAP